MVFGGVYYRRKLTLNQNKMKITKKQLQYLKSLDSKKNKRKFLLDCLIENVKYKSEVQEIIEKSNKISKFPTDFCVEITENNKAVLQMIWNGFHQMDAVLNSKYLISNSLHTYCLASNARICKGKKMPIITSEEFLNYIGKEDLVYLISKEPNYSPEEIELVKHNINQMEFGLYTELQSILESNSFLSIQDAMKIEKAVLKYHEIAK